MEQACLPKSITPDGPHAGVEGASRPPPDRAVVSASSLADSHLTPTPSRPILGRDEAP